MHKAKTLILFYFSHFSLQYGYKMEGMIDIYTHILNVLKIWWIQLHLCLINWKMSQKCSKLKYVTGFSNNELPHIMFSACTNSILPYT